MHVAVTGGRGFIGTHIVSALRERGHQTVVIDVFGAQPVSVLDGEALRAALAGADAVVHLAGPVREPMLREPAAGMRLQVAGTRTLLDACVASGVGWVILASSFYVYAGARVDPVTEETPIDRAALDLFGVAKMASERLCARYASRGAIQYAICRFGSAYGAGGSNAVRTFVETALAGAPITVWGQGLRRNQYTYVGDIADAVATLAEGRTAFAGATFNIVSQAVTSTGELARLVAAVTGSRVEFLADRREGPSLPYIDARRSRTRLGWRETALEDGVRATVRDLRLLVPVA